LGQTLLDAILKAPEATTEVVSGESTILDEFIQFLSEETSKKKEKKKEWDRVSGGYDDQYNTIEGIHPDSTGLGAAEVRAGSDFGSGYRGLPTSLLGVPIDPEVLRFRENVIDDSDEWSALEARLNKKQAASQAQLGQFRGTDLFAPNLAGVEGLAKTTGLKEVRLSDFKITAEDADTILLKRRGLTNLLSPSISVRLSGIDAPETAGHAADPMEEVRIWQSQPGGEEAAERLSRLIDEQGDLRLLIGSDQTYGRSLGVLVGDEGENLSLSLLREGMVAALPFGKKSGDIISREAAAGAEEQARFRDEGIWSLARYKAIHEASEATGQPITFNTFTELTRLSRNLMLGAYGTYLQGFGDEERELTGEEVATSRRLGRALRRRFGPNAFVGQKFSGMPNSGTFAAETRDKLTEFKKDFASRWDPAKRLAEKFFGSKNGSIASMLESTSFIDAMKSGRRIREIGHGGFGRAFLHEAEVGGEKFQYVMKETLEELKALPQGERLYSFGQKTLENEYGALRSLDGDIMPATYGMHEGKLFMEYMPGQTLEKFKEAGIKLPKSVLKDVEEQAFALSKKGFLNEDISRRNVMYDPTSGRTSWIDFGSAQNKIDPFTAAERMQRQIKGLSDDMSGLAEYTPSSLEGIHPLAENTLGALAVKNNSDFGSGFADRLVQFFRPGRGNQAVNLSGKGPWQKWTIKSEKELVARVLPAAKEKAARRAAEKADTVLFSAQQETGIGIIKRARGAKAEEDLVPLTPDRMPYKNAEHFANVILARRENAKKLEEAMARHKAMMPEQSLWGAEAGEELVALEKARLLEEERIKKLMFPEFSSFEKEIGGMISDIIPSLPAPRASGVSLSNVVKNANNPGESLRKISQGVNAVPFINASKGSKMHSVSAAKRSYATKR